MTRQHLRIFEYWLEGGRDPLWVAAPDRQAADAAAMKKGWTEKAGREIFADSSSVPQDRKGLKQMGCDVVVGL